MLDFFKKPIFLIILAAALIIAGIWAYVSNRSSSSSQTASNSASTTNTSSTTDSTATISNLSNVDAVAQTEAIKTQIALADSKAAEVDKKLQLIAIQVVLSADIAVASGDSFYVYSSTADKTNNWIIAISNLDNSFVRSRTPKEDFIGDLVVIDRSFMKNNYIQALQIAEKNGGLSFREANTLDKVTITLKKAEPKSWLYWFVDYSAKNGQKEIQIDAGSGAIVEPATTNSSSQ